MIIRFLNLKPVSYTHLDVYKRQNYIRSATESAGSIFIKIEHENDLGVDALIEFVENEVPLNKQIAVQIKSGASYYSGITRECLIPVGKPVSYTHLDVYKRQQLRCQ